MKAWVVTVMCRQDVMIIYIYNNVKKKKIQKIYMRLIPPQKKHIRMDDSANSYEQNLKKYLHESS